VASCILCSVSDEFVSRVAPVAILPASVMSAPNALTVSKIEYPETEESLTAVGKRGNFVLAKHDDANIMHAATIGAVIGTQLMLNIAGNSSPFFWLHV
jgi:nucleoside permease NupC